MFPYICERLIQDARAIAAVLPFAFRNTSALDARCEEYRRSYHERRNSLQKQATNINTRLTSLFTSFAKIFLFVIILDEAVAREDTIGFNINAAYVGFSLRSSYPSQTQMPGFLSCFRSTGIPPQHPDSELQTEQVVGSILRNSRTEYSLAPAALNSSIIHQRPSFAYDIQRFLQTIRNISQSQNIQLFNEHGPLTFAKPLRVGWNDIIGLVAEIAKVGKHLPSGEMVQTTDVISMEHPQIIFKTAMKDVAFKDNRVNLCLRFNMTSPLRITEVRMTVPQPPTLASTLKLRKR
ncbi:MAG: hypothetical protein EZS28_009202 [Streblomastix strix]|uniref:Uncharacterized protein n=1 Tax=Streblomastix strix TaxID=222440 RepID=A0A5J4WJQ8_9EUKA|nr:MAG: hypothetical protein EZS28_009202 [Streblomastix strix]